jgi:hypothetical protein
MTVLALLLLTVGLADLARPAGGARRPAALVVAVLAGAVLGWGAGLPWWWIVLVVAAAAGWIVSTPARWAGLWPAGGLAAAVVVVLALGDVVPDAGGWLTRWYAGLGLDVLDGVPFERFALVTGYVVFLIASANIVVRMVLAGAHVPVETEQSLKGGRVLGPIERVFILATALSGELTALAAIVAAKGIVRFPELQKDEEGNKAEYVLVGSFVSWALALVLVPLL